MPELHAITATFHVVTPLFLGDAEREATRFSLASLRGALRFWWRAREYPRILASKAGGDQNEALRLLQDKERRLFGTAGAEGSAFAAPRVPQRPFDAAAGHERAVDRPHACHGQDASTTKERLGQSRVLMRIKACRLGPSFAKDAELVDGSGQRVGPGARYLGYGLMGAFGARAGKLDRSCFAAGGTITIELAFRPGTSEDDRKSCVAALRLLGLLGGLGARSRRGFGSLSLAGLDGELTDLDAGSAWQAPQTRAEYHAALDSLLPQQLDQALPPFTAFSGLSRIEIVHEGADPLQVLDHVGKMMQRYRAWGFRGQINGEPSERNFERDHDWSKRPADPAFRSYVPQRAAFGLPHSYGKPLSVVPAAAQAGDRRASPLLIHIHRLGDRYIAVLSLLPAEYVPGNRVKWGQGKEDAATMPADWTTVLHGFFDGPPKAEERKLAPYFPKDEKKEERQILPRPEAGGAAR
jgi:CRISPR-associated protein Cmr1